MLQANRHAVLISSSLTTGIVLGNKEELVVLLKAVQKLADEWVVQHGPNDLQRGELKIKTKAT